MSVRGIDFGQVRAELIRKRPGLLPLLKQTVLIEKRRGDFAITSIASPAPFLDIEKTPEGRAGTFRIDIGLIPERLVPGTLDGAIRITTDDPRFPELTVPVRAEIR